MGQIMGLLILVIETWSCMPGMGMALYNGMKNVKKNRPAFICFVIMYGLTNAQKCEFESAK